MLSQISYWHVTLVSIIISRNINPNNQHYNLLKTNSFKLKFCWRENTHTFPMCFTYCVANNFDGWSHCVWWVVDLDGFIICLSISAHLPLSVCLSSPVVSVCLFVSLFEVSVLYEPIHCIITSLTMCVLFIRHTWWWTGWRSGCQSNRRRKKRSSRDSAHPPATNQQQGLWPQQVSWLHASTSLMSICFQWNRSADCDSLQWIIHRLLMDWSLYDLPLSTFDWLIPLWSSSFFFFIR